MKNIEVFGIAIGMSVVVIASITSCDLEPQVFDRLNPGIYYQSATDAELAVAGVYNQALMPFGQVNNNNPLIMNTATTDEFNVTWGSAVWNVYSRFLWTANTDGVVQRYEPFVRGITNAVNNIELIEPIDMNPDLKERYQAELRAIMAFLGYYLYDFYGPAAIVTDPEITLNPATDFQPERPAREWMVNFIEEQGRTAADGLPVSYSSSSDWGRFTKGGALMVLLKLAMHEKNWQEAVDISKEIMEMDYYELQDDYLSVFSVENAMNDELIFVIPKSVAFNNNNWLAHVLPPNYIEPNGIPIARWNGYRVPWEMYDKYEEDVDDRVRRATGAILRYIPTADGIEDIKSMNFPWVPLGAVPYKYPADPNSTGSAHGNDVVVFRYADLLLLRAEALNNLNGPNQESIDLINMIRSRANATPVELSQFSNTQSLNDYILDERFRELFQEGHRRPDLIRHGKFLSEGIERGAAADERHLLFPIPQAAIDANPNIQQNTGY